LSLRGSELADILDCKKSNGSSATLVVTHAAIAYWAEADPTAAGVAGRLGPTDVNKRHVRPLSLNKIQCHFAAAGPKYIVAI